MSSNEALLNVLECFVCSRDDQDVTTHKSNVMRMHLWRHHAQRESVQNHHTAPLPHRGPGQGCGPAEHGTFGVQNSRDHGLRSTQRQRNARCSRPLLLRLAIIVRWCPSSRPAPCEMAPTFISSRARDRILSRASGEASVARVSWKSYIGNFR